LGASISTSFSPTTKSVSAISMHRGQVAALDTLTVCALAISIEVVAIAAARIVGITVLPAMARSSGMKPL
jgi:hypothetical protein